MKKVIKRSIDPVMEIEKLLEDIQKEIRDVHTVDVNSYKLGAADGLSMALDFLKCHNDKIN